MPAPKPPAIPLQAENEQLGKDLSEGSVQKLKTEAALQKEYAQVAWG